jgi:hypothetical protein
VPTNRIVPDAFKTLAKASQELMLIGWDQWFKGRILKEWAMLVSYDIQIVDSGVKSNTPEKWKNRFELGIYRGMWIYIYGKSRSSRQVNTFYEFKNST